MREMGVWPSSNPMARPRRSAFSTTCWQISKDERKPPAQRAASATEAVSSVSRARPIGQQTMDAVPDESDFPAAEIILEHRIKLGANNVEQPHGIGQGTRLHAHVDESGVGIEISKDGTPVASGCCDWETELRSRSTRGAACGGGTERCPDQWWRTGAPVHRRAKCRAGHAVATSTVAPKPPASRRLAISDMLAGSPRSS
jgi:hypothetical protein